MVYSIKYLFQYISVTDGSWHAGTSFLIVQNYNIKDSKIIHHFLNADKNSANGQGGNDDDKMDETAKFITDKLNELWLLGYLIKQKLYHGIKSE